LYEILEPQVSEIVVAVPEESKGAKDDLRDAGVSCGSSGYNGSTDRIPMKVSPKTAPYLAEGSVAFVYKKFGFALPYTPASLILVDAIVDKIKATGATEQQASGVLSGLGCYVGEVFVRHAKASWRWTAEMGMPSSCRFPVVVALPGVIGCDAIGKVFERFGDGAAESVALLYEIAAASRLSDPSSNR
jgi:hypothetical protein